MDRNVNPLLSLTAKLFYFTTLLVLTTAGTLAIRSDFTLRNISLRYTIDALTNAVEKSAAATSGIADEWDRVTKEALGTLAVADPQERDKILGELVARHSSYVAVAIYQVTDKGLAQIAAKFNEGKDDINAKSFNLNKFIAATKPKAESRLLTGISRPEVKRLYFNLYDITREQAILTIAYAANVKNNGGRYVAVLWTWPTQIGEALSSKELADARPLLLGPGGRVVFSPETKDYDEKSGKAFAAHPLLAGADDKDNDTHEKVSTTIFKSYSFMNKKRNGTSAKVLQYGLSVILQQDASVAESASFKLLRESLLLSVFITLVAMFFAYFGASGLTANLRSVIEITRKIAAGDFTASLAKKSRDEIGELSGAVNMMAGHIVELLHNQVQQARMEKELETATHVQETIFPQNTLVAGPITIKGFNQAASECGGDWWGTFSTGAGVEYIFIADAMGHGVSAALVTTMAYATCSTLGSMIRENHRELGSPAAILQRLNEVIYNAVRGRISMSFFALMIDTKQGLITFANAGHNFPLLLPMSADDPRIKKKSKDGELTPIPLRVTGNILGISPVESYQEKSLTLCPGDKIILFTDGLVECKNPEGASWGSRGLNAKLSQFARLGPEELNEKLVGELYTFFNGTPQDDDITVVVAEISKQCRFTAPAPTTSPRVAPPITRAPPPPPPPAAPKIRSA